MNLNSSLIRTDTIDSSLSSASVHAVIPNNNQASIEPGNLVFEVQKMHLFVVILINSMLSFFVVFLHLNILKHFKVMQVERREIMHQRQDKSRLESAFIKDMSHDIHTLINGVSGMLQSLLKGELDVDQRRKARFAYSSTESLLSLTNDMLNFHRQDSIKIELEKTDFNLRGLLEDLAETMAFQAQDKGLELILNIVGIHTTMVVGDPARLRQMLTTLINNAIQFTESGNVIISAKLVERENVSMQFVCSVTDSGTGIDEDKLSEFFKNSRSIDDSAEKKYVDLGLGLVKDICQLMEGDIEVCSKNERGSRFNLTLKMGYSSFAQPFIAPGSIHDLCILLVDENSRQREALRAQLNSWDIIVVEAESADSALVQLQARLKLSSDHSSCHMYDAVFINKDMPTSNGLVLAGNIRDEKRLSELPLIMMTKMGDKKETKTYAKLDINGFINKPAITEDLFNVLIELKIKSHIMPLPPLTVAQIESEKDVEFGIESSACANMGVAKIQSISKTEMKRWPDETRILLVEDNMINREVALDLLEGLDLTVDVAYNGKEALHYLKASDLSCPYSLILMDCEMPLMDGYEACRNIRLGYAGIQNKDIIIMAMTANVLNGDEERCNAVGMNDYLSKPINFDLLVSKLKKWLNQADDSELISATSNTTYDKALDYSRVGTDTENSNMACAINVDKSALHFSISETDDLLESLVNVFITDMPNQIFALKKAVHKHQVNEICHYGEMIKGVAAKLSAHLLHQMAKDIVQAAVDGDQQKTAELLPDLHIAYQHVHEALNQHLLENPGE
ncbi:MAG: response regulator [Pseudomonadales bacterium]|nr:response regulator [Pseudomonadales bacterium]